MLKVRPKMPKFNVSLCSAFSNKGPSELKEVGNQYKNIMVYLMVQIYYDR